MKPFLKWAGGKTRLLPELMKYVPETYGRYIEPFVGGGALLFALKPEKALLADSNFELIWSYIAIQKRPSFLMAFLDKLRCADNANFYLQQRENFNKNKAMPYHIAGQLIYLNKTCYNGLYRVNKKGEFNVPYGRYHTPDLYEAKNIEAISDFLSNHKRIEHSYFTKTLSFAKPGDFIYCDPPYHGGFTAYTAQGFTEEDQMELAGMCADLSNRGCHILASNSNTDFIWRLWEAHSCFDIHEVEAPHSINCNGNGRGKVKELIITNVRKD
ncbi:MAG: DNA adenine methylase [Nitrospirae bacterium]|uniref:DNA adenine methylase n=1 Tax=Candidatus Magnetobacterium casense TaxID=1455061 RepID=UPI00058CF410|nr:DNA adenine methylase [Candidatus Magnetobacterium casensis]MBF0336925.1 DNA adenine methylase [Nitrospirota bacterium]